MTQGAGPRESSHYGFSETSCAKKSSWIWPLNSSAGLLMLPCRINTVSTGKITTALILTQVQKVAKYCQSCTVGLRGAGRSKEMPKWMANRLDCFCSAAVVACYLTLHFPCQGLISSPACKAHTAPHVQRHPNAHFNAMI